MLDLPTIPASTAYKGEYPQSSTTLGTPSGAWPSSEPLGDQAITCNRQQLCSWFLAQMSGNYEWNRNGENPLNLFEFNVWLFNIIEHNE